MIEPETKRRLQRKDLVGYLVTGLEDALELQSEDPKPVTELGERATLIGSEARVDSLGLVTLILDVEQRLEEEYGIVMVIADERAMSQKNSPFRNISTLADYICDSLKDNGYAIEG